MMRFLVYPAAGDLAAAAAEYLTAQACVAIAERGAFHLALSGGSTPKAIFEHIAKARTFDARLVAATHLYWGDERSVPNDHAESNVRMARQSFIDTLAFPAANVHLVNGGASNLEAEAERYDGVLRATLPKNKAGFPIFDVVLLGMGTDGHTASLFPGTRALDEKQRVFVANDVPQLSTRRLTLTFPAINAAREIVVLSTGESKATLIHEIRNGSAQYPICRVRGNGSNVIWMIDAAADAASRETVSRKG